MDIVCDCQAGGIEFLLRMNTAEMIGVAGFDVVEEPANADEALRFSKRALTFRSFVKAAAAQMIAG
jgi:hypothetical protein